jgi:hypothetical protein
VPFKCNLHRYNVVGVDASVGASVLVGLIAEVGLCRLNQVDPWPITYSLSNP